MKINVIGLGKLGAPFAVMAESAGHSVLGVDDSSETVQAINDRRAHIVEPDYEALLKSATHLEAVTTPSDQVLDKLALADMTFIIVPTPSMVEGNFSLRYITDAVALIGHALFLHDRPHTVVIVSTVSPGSMQWIQEELTRQAGREVDLCYNPEFIALGSVLRNLAKPDFVLIGESSTTAGDALVRFYHSVLASDAPIHRMNFINAEIAKISLNAFITMKISFANTLSQICAAVPGADCHTIVNAIGRDVRIGRKYLEGGVPFGGPCFPRDNRAFGHFAQQYGNDARLAVATHDVNTDQFRYIIDLIWSLQPKRLAILGLAYKPNTTITDYALGFTLADWAESAQLSVASFDENLKHPTSVESAAKAVEDADLVVLTHGHYASECTDESVVIIDCWHRFAPAPNIIHLGAHRAEELPS